MSCVENGRFVYLPASNLTEVKLLSKSIPTISRATFQDILQAVAAILAGKQVNQVRLKSIIDGNETSFANINAIIACLHTIMRAALRLPADILKRDVIVEDLRELNLPEEFITDIIELLYGQERVQMENINNKPSLHTLKTLRWRVDVSIATSVLNRILEPTIVMELSLSDGTRRTFEVSMKSFHRLRFNVAKVLKEMETLQKRNTLRIKE